MTENTEPRHPAHEADPNVEVFEIERELDCTIPHDELERLSDELANANVRLEDTEEKAKQVAADLRARKKRIRQTMKALSEKVRERKYRGMVLCRERHDYLHAKKTVTRLDTGESWEQTMTAEELQRDFLPPIPAAGGAEPTPKPGRKRCNCPVTEAEAVPGETWACPEHGRMWKAPDGTIHPRDPVLPVEGEEVPVGGEQQPATPEWTCDTCGERSADPWRDPVTGKHFDCGGTLRQMDDPAEGQGHGDAGNGTSGYEP